MIRNLLSLLILSSTILYSEASLSTTVFLEEGWNLKGSSCYINPTETFNNSNIITVWRWDAINQKWQVWSPDSGLMAIIEKYVNSGNLELLVDLKPYDGFWINTAQPISIELCNSTSTLNQSEEYSEGYETLLKEGIAQFLNKAKEAGNVEIIDDDEMQCEITTDGNSTISIFNCSDPDAGGNFTINWNELELIENNGNSVPIVWADNNSLCVNIEKFFNNGTISYVSCAIIDTLNPTDEEIKEKITQGSTIPFWFNPTTKNWEPSGFCLTYLANGTVISTDPDGDILETCSYYIDNGAVITTCPTSSGNLTKIGKAISQTEIPDEDITGNIVNVKFYINGNLIGWNNFLSIKVNNCQEFWESYESGETPSDYSDTISGKILLTENGTLNNNLKIRITPDIEQIDGDWGGIICQINADGSFGDKCVLHGDLSNFTEQHTFQIIIFSDENNNWHFDPDEPVIFGEENVTYNAWDVIDLNNINY